MEDWRYLFAMRYYQKNIQKYFPEEGFGIGDRFILNRISVENTKNIIRNSNDNSINMFYHFICVSSDMEKYGFKPIKPKSEGDRWLKMKKTRRAI
ncbi:MAG: hypothetical protein NTZ83_06340 [Candidatus Pacearchaeota archaeon]|nr:hypothetical protein [Candidatus Pacearchaeota archaeon]